MKTTARALSAVLALSGTALAASSHRKAQPWVYDPDATGIAEARWVANAGVEGHGSF